MRGMIAYIPLYVNLTSTQGCIRGLAHACVCVWRRGRGRGMSEGECAPPFVNFTSLKGTWRVWWWWERGRENFDPLFQKLTSPPGCMMGKRRVGTKGACGKIDSFRVGLPLLLFLINSRSFFLLDMNSFSDMHNLSLVFGFCVFSLLIILSWGSLCKIADGVELRVKEFVVCMCRYTTVKRFSPRSHRAVLLRVAPFLRHCKGRGYYQSQ